MRVFLVLGLVLAPVAASAQPAPTPWPTKAWAESAPDAQGLDRGPLETLHKEFEKGEHGYVDSMLVIRNGAVVFEKSYKHAYDALFQEKGQPGIYNYYDPEWHPFYHCTDLHTMQSVSKSVTSALVGIAIKRGEIPGLDVKVMPYFQKFTVKPDPRRDAMTLRHVLTMSTGIRW